MQPIQAQLLLDIFGKQDDNEVVCGLLDAFDTQEFDAKLSTLKNKWDQLEAAHCRKSSLATSFHSWFSQHHAPYMRESMISSVRACVGIKGEPTPWYTTNNNECINKVFKNAVASRLSIPECIEKIEEFVKSQLCQVELAITGEGLYRFRANYRDLEVPKEEWLKKSKEEKKKHVAKVFGCQVRPVATIQNNPSMELGGGEFNLEQLRQDNEFAAPIQRGRKISISHSESGLSVVIPPHSLATMWKKAETILNSDGGLCKAVGKFHDDDHANKLRASQILVCLILCTNITRERLFVMTVLCTKHLRFASTP